ncbi:hypothetical protein [Aquimarina spongiae]|uniref:Uncharacterized protein n=1 Tax=Aquimarina spongiae TaxID=570521 RepID=A0A1M6FPD6_9FLAO|nr:hypothetical protein [Aquimarina spongiae]SHI99469.1 hypothetical protein SAMN04488508_104390 [Aquimarina spongiae]
MKKLFLLAFVLCAGLSVQAQQYSWQELHELHRDELYPLAKDVSEITDKVIANGNVISIVKSTGTTSLVKELDKSVPIEFYNYKLLTSTGRELKLTDPLMANKVVDKFFDVLRRVKDNAETSNEAEIRAILDGL